MNRIEKLRAFAGRRVSFTTDVAPTGLVARVDRGRLHQVLVNLLDNAARHGPPGGVVTVVARTEGERMVLEISDEGREGVGPTDMDATSPLGVGESINRRGEDVVKQEGEEGREHAGTRGSSDRPAGVSDERDATSVDPGTGSGGPTMPAGDQGG